MSLLSTHLGVRATWTDDRGQPTPAFFDLPDKEYLALTHEVGVIDFTHVGVIALSGSENVAFLAPLLTNQVKQVTDSRVVYAALLTPQGRFLWDFTVAQRKSRLFLVTEPDRSDALVQRLQMYVLRSKVELNNLSETMGCLGIVGPQAIDCLVRALPEFATALKSELGTAIVADKEKILLWRDPRHAAFGWRILADVAHLPSIWNRLLDAGARMTGITAWEHYRILNGLPRGGSEFIPDISPPMEAGLLEMHGVDFTKGCYVGQETTTRTYRRGTLKKRLYGVTLSGDETTVFPGTPVCLPGGKEVGTLTSISRLQSQCIGLALLRIEDIQNEDRLIAGAASVTIHTPDWASWKREI